MSKPLRFHELEVGDHFISFPQDGDDSGHGGYRRGSYVFKKTAECPPGTPYGLEPNDVRLKDNVPSRCTPDMLVYKVFVGSIDKDLLRIVDAVATTKMINHIDMFGEGECPFCDGALDSLHPECDKHGSDCIVLLARKIKGTLAP